MMMITLLPSPYVNFIKLVRIIKIINITTIHNYQFQILSSRFSLVLKPREFQRHMRQRETWQSAGYTDLRYMQKRVPKRFDITKVAPFTTVKML